MNLLFCAVTLFAVIIFLSNATAKQLRCTGYDVKEVEKISPMTKRVKCLYECMLSTAGMVKVDGLIEVDKFMNFLKTSKQLDSDMLTKIEAVVEKCKNHKHLSEDKCETVGLLVQCTTEEATKSGLSAKSMLNAIRYPFDSQQMRNGNAPPSFQTMYRNPFFGIGR